MSDHQDSGVQLPVGPRPFGFCVVDHTPGQSVHVRYRPYLGMYLLTGVGAFVLALVALIFFGVLGVRETWAVVGMAGASAFWGVMGYYLLFGSRADLRVADNKVRFKLGRSLSLPCSSVEARCAARPVNEPDGPAYVFVELPLDADEVGHGRDLKQYLSDAGGREDGKQYYVVLRFPCSDQEVARQVAGALERLLAEVLAGSSEG